MRKRTIVTASLLMISVAILASIGLSVQAQQVRTPSTETIPAITNTSAGVVYLCVTPFVTPASASTGSSGFVRVSCSSPALGRLQLGSNAPLSLTPTLTLATGFDKAAIVLYNTAGNPCSFNFDKQTIQVGNVTISTGSFLNRTLTFANPPSVSTQLLASNYDYCLHYSNFPVTGTATFSIVWT